MTNDLFFTLLLYHKAKTRQYRFYDCLVAHDEAYIDLNRYAEPTDTLTVTYKVMDNDFHNVNVPYYDSASQTWLSALRPTYICSARYIGNETNGVQVQFVDEYEGGVNAETGRPPFADNPIRAQIIVNGKTYQFTSNSIGFYNYRNGNAREDEYRSPFDKKIVATLKTTSIDRYFVNEEQLFINTHTASPRRLAEGQGRALLKLFAGFAFHNGQLQTNRSVARIYSFYIQNANDEYTMRLQPAEDLGTGELGMYDSINDVFYPNKNSAGYFTVEENITDKIILDVESQIDTKRLSVYCTSYNMPYQLSDGRLMLVKKHNLPPVIDGFIDLWDGMGKQSDEEGIFNHVTLERNQTGGVTYTDNGDGSITISATSASADYSHWAYKLTGVAVGSIVLVGTCGGSSTALFIVMNYTGSTPSSNGLFRWYVYDGRKQQYITEDYEDAAINSIFTASNPHTYTAAGLSDITANGNTLIGATYNGSTTLTIYGMVLYDKVLTKEQLLEVAQWADQYIKRPQASSRSIEE